MKENKSASRRGEVLREHILWVAKEVFLEMGFERASMDVVASRAETSKRSLYAHFESKEKLFLAFLELMRGLFFNKLRTPDVYSEKPAEAMVMFCGRYLEILLFRGSIRLCRVILAEATRFREGASLYFEVVFTEVHARLSAYLKAKFELSPRASAEAAQRLLGEVLHPRFPRALFGIEPLADTIDDNAMAPDFDLKAIRKSVADLIESLPKH
jgi:AcrR family transcriptional regulator